MLASCATPTPKSGADAGAQAGEEFNEDGLLPNRTLLWSDEFNGPGLDTTNWTFELGDGCPNLCGWGNNERQLYTRENHRVEDGFLTITARHEDDGRYTSTRIKTQGKQSFTYGRIETRAKLPVGEGLWPAFWALGENITEVSWPRCGEIDVLEYVGRAPGEIFTTLHTQAGHGDSGTGKTTPFPNIEDGFHRYAAEWTPERIEFFVDDESVYTFAPEELDDPAVWPFDQPFFLLLNVAIGGNFGGPGVDDSVFPQNYVIDYVRVYAPRT